MDDFRTLDIQVVDRRTRIRQRRRDHGHEQMIKDSYLLGRGAHGAGADVSYVWETAQLFLRTREALEQSQRVVVDAFDAARLAKTLTA
jgi:hypothetical protein